MKRKRPAWTGKAVGTMHVYGITQKDVADHVGMAEDYISMLLRGARTPAGAKERILQALNEMVHGHGKDDVSRKS